MTRLNIGEAHGRRFNGIVFSLARWDASKAEANEFANWYRKRGWLARVVPMISPQTYPPSLARRGYGIYLKNMQKRKGLG